MLRRAVVALVVAFVAASADTRAQSRRAVEQRAPAAQTSTLDQKAQAEFLRSATITSSRKIGRGITGALRVTLTAKGVTHDAAFQSVDERSSTGDLAAGRKRAGELRFVDTYRYNIAAFELASLLGLAAMMPTTVVRTIEGRRGSLTWWIDDVLMEEAEREAKGIQPPSPLEFNKKRQRMFVFAELVYDTDRNKGNVVYTRDWDVMMIDFTRAFRLHHELRKPDELQMCDRNLLRRMEKLTGAEVKSAVGEHLTDGEVNAVMARRDLIVARITQRVRELGEARVLY